MKNFSIFLTTLFVLVIAHFTFSGLYVSATTFTFVNKCGYTVWPGLLAGASSPKLETTGFELQPSTSRTLPAPAGWSGRFWGRTSCTTNPTTGIVSCLTGDCGSNQIECNGSGATPPATLAEFTLNGSDGKDFYDVSLVDGFNVAMIIESSGGSGGCETTGCLVDLNRRCPAELKAENGGACRSACEAFGNEEYCCSGAHNTPDTCKPSVYSEVFKNACPRAYSYAYDDGTSTFTCSAADYVITFCPSTPSQKSSMDPSPSSVATNPGSNTASGAVTESSSGSGSGSASMMADGSWLANLASGSSSNTRHPTIFLQFTLVFLVIVSLFTSLFG